MVGKELSSSVSFEFSTATVKLTNFGTTSGFPKRLIYLEFNQRINSEELIGDISVSGDGQGKLNQIRLFNKERDEEWFEAEQKRLKKKGHPTGYNRLQGQFRAAQAGTAVLVVVEDLVADTSYTLTIPAGTVSIHHYHHHHHLHHHHHHHYADKNGN